MTHEDNVHTSPEETISVMEEIVRATEETREYDSNCIINSCLDTLKTAPKSTAKHSQDLTYVCRVSLDSSLEPDATQNETSLRRFLESIDRKPYFDQGRDSLARVVNKYTEKYEQKL